MTIILREESLEKFKKEFNLESNNIIITLDSKNKIATYIVDATMRITADYEKILKYYNN